MEACISWNDPVPRHLPTIDVQQSLRVDQTPEDKVDKGRFSQRYLWDQNPPRNQPVSDTMDLPVGLFPYQSCFSHFLCSDMIE